MLLEVWPRIMAAVPQATLHLYYGFKNWRKASACDPAQGDLIERLGKQIIETPGVVYHGRVSQTELTKAYLESSVLLHPSWFTETSGITFMQAQAACLRVVTTPLAALPETLAGYDRVSWVDGVWTDKDYQDRFVAEAVKSLRS